MTPETQDASRSTTYRHQSTSSTRERLPDGRGQRQIDWFPGMSATDLWNLYKEELARFLAMTRPTWEDVQAAVLFGDPEKLIPELKKRHPHLSIRELWSIIKSPQALGAVI